MKKLTNTAFLILLSAGCMFAQTITVQGEKKLNTDFKKYKTFGWMQSEQKPGNQIVEYTYAEVIDPNSPAMKADKSERKAEKREEKGMTKTDKKMVKNEKKSMRHHRKDEVVIYSYSFILPSQDSVINNAATNSIEDELEGRGYKKDNTGSPDLLVAYKIFDRSTQIKGYNAPATDVNGNKMEEVHQPQDTITYALKPGTVLITLVDAKTSAVVWEGYASGVAQSNDMINDKLRVKEAVNLIFKKYEFRGDKYSMTN